MRRHGTCIRRWHGTYIRQWHGTCLYGQLVIRKDVVAEQEQVTDTVRKERVTADEVAERDQRRARRRR
jgi:hypothetical protein